MTATPVHAATPAHAAPRCVAWFMPQALKYTYDPIPLVGITRFISQGATFPNDGECLTTGRFLERNEGWFNGSKSEGYWVRSLPGEGSYQYFYEIQPADGEPPYPKYWVNDNDILWRK
ncbi:hypothetical protein E1281_38380 [Actinomadura sp. KC345]|uniref:hypothetical protein n=1 Tax=Actinomadura sp. KC345 TaxID=2530371 RepID=UPI00104ACC2E|nr:hypothetical protein [Actinomadura sp. KC345]TDC40152.1 hypothetical protein E1281_38380 [Actinomadura sp. KC345]